MFYDRNPIALADAVHMIPALAAAPHASRSERYAHVPTIAVLKALETEGFQIYGLNNTRVRDQSRHGHQKHMVRLRRPEHAQAEQSPEVILINSHDGSSSYRLLSGVFRFVCSNGLIVGDKWANIRIQHTGRDIISDVIEGTYSVVETFDKIADNIHAMKAITLQPAEQEAYATAAVGLRYDDGKAPVQAAAFLRPRRPADIGNDLWTTFNRVQENMIKGGLRGVTRDEHGRQKRATTRAVNGIDGDVKLNQALFTLAEHMAKLKA